MPKTRVMEKLVELGLKAAACASIFIVFLILLFVGKESLPFVIHQGVAALWSDSWVPVSFQEEQYGIIPLLVGSLMVTVLAMLVATPFGVCGAVYIAEVASPAEREFLKPFIEVLAGVPSVVLGFFGLVVVAPLVKSVFGLNSGLTGLTGALLLALMAIPTIITIAEDAIRNVPVSYRHASMALGAKPMQTVWRVTVPAALPGIMAALLLGMGRVIGETMTVLMVTGNATQTTIWPLESVRTLTATIAAEMGEVSFGGMHYSSLFCIGFLLLLITFALNHLGQRILRQKEKPQG